MVEDIVYINNIKDKQTRQVRLSSNGELTMKNQVTLYIGTHNNSGLKYFGKTTQYFTQEDLQKYYHGSGKDWNIHLEEFGDDVTMEIYGIFSEEEVENKALTFSLINDITESKLWANMKPENGLDGGSAVGHTKSEETKEKMRKPKSKSHIESMKKPKTEKHKQNISKGRKGIASTFTQETLDKQNKNRKGMLGLSHSEESKQKMANIRKTKTGKKASRKIKVEIYNNGVLFEVAEGNFEPLCKEFNLPCSALKKTYRDNTILTNRKDSFNGWYARKV